MHVLSFTQQTTLRGGSTKKSHAKLQQYLQSIGWETRKFTNAKLESMLAASCLRYLGGIEDLSFVLELAEEIRRKYKQTLKVSVWYCVDALDTLAMQLKDNSISPTDTEKIHILVDEAQKLITKRSYLDASNS